MKINYLSPENKIIESLEHEGDNGIFILINSISNQENPANDLTIKKIKKFVTLMNKNGFCIMLLNESTCDKYDSALRQRYLDLISKKIDLYNTVWAAWGKNPVAIYDFKGIIKSISSSKHLQWIKFTGGDHPRSPTLPSYNTSFENFDIEAYIHTLR